jgi:hypothetical protein
VAYHACRVLTSLFTKSHSPDSHRALARLPAWRAARRQRSPLQEPVGYAAHLTPIEAQVHVLQFVVQCMLRSCADKSQAVAVALLCPVVGVGKLRD